MRRTYNLVGDNTVTLNIVQLIIAAGVTVTCFASFALLRSAFFAAPAAVAGLHERAQTEQSQPAPEAEPETEAQQPEWVVPTAQPTIEMEPGQTEIPFVQATEGHDANQDLDYFWQKRQYGKQPSTSTVPGCAPCEEPTNSGFRTGTGTIDQASFNQYLQQRTHTTISTGNWGINGYTTTSGMRSSQ